MSIETILMSETEEHDQRQLYKMAASIRSFEAGKLNLFTLIGCLDALLGWLNVEDPGWSEPIRDALERMEFIYAVAVDQNEGRLSPDEQAEIMTAVREIDSLVARRLRSQ